MQRGSDTLDQDITRLQVDEGLVGIARSKWGLTSTAHKDRADESKEERVEVGGSERIREKSSE